MSERTRKLGGKRVVRRHPGRVNSVCSLDRRVLSGGCHVVDDESFSPSVISLGHAHTRSGAFLLVCQSPQRRGYASAPCPARPRDCRPLIRPPRSPRPVCRRGTLSGRTVQPISAKQIRCRCRTRLEAPGANAAAPAPLSAEVRLLRWLFTGFSRRWLAGGLLVRSEGAHLHEQAAWKPARTGQRRPSNPSSSSRPVNRTEANFLRASVPRQS